MHQMRKGSYGMVMVGLMGGVSRGKRRRRAMPLAFSADLDAVMAWQQRMI
jgi:hypothetical protein